MITTKNGKGKSHGHNKKGKSFPLPLSHVSTGFFSISLNSLLGKLLPPSHILSDLILLVNSINQIKKEREKGEIDRDFFWVFIWWKFMKRARVYAAENSICLWELFVIVLIDGVTVTKIISYGWITRGFGDEREFGFEIRTGNLFRCFSAFHVFRCWVLWLHCLLVNFPFLHHSSLFSISSSGFLFFFFFSIILFFSVWGWSYHTRNVIVNSVGKL